MPALLAYVWARALLEIIAEPKKETSPTEISN